MKVIVFVNGKPTSGKDTFVLKALTALPSYDLYGATTSSIDCVRDLLSIKASDKRPETRKVLAEVGAALEEYNGFRTKQTMVIVRRVFTNHNVCFVHVRELGMMERMEAEYRTKYANTVAFVRLFVDRDVPEVTNNASDKNVAEGVSLGEPSGPLASSYTYNYLVNNNGTLHELEQEAELFVQWLVKCYD